LSVLGEVGLEVLVPRLGGIGLDELRLHFQGRAAQLALPAGAALSRIRFDSALVDAALEAGAHFLPETRALVAEPEAHVRRVELVQHGRQTTASARLVLVASGLGCHWMKNGSAAHSQTAAWSRIGAGCTVADFPGRYQDRIVFMAVGRSGYVGLV